MSQITPTMGRVVKYLHPGSADGKYPPMESPAIIQKVYPMPSPADSPDADKLAVDLFVMSNSGGIFFAKHCIEGKHWDWLDFTKAQASR